MAKQFSREPPRDLTPSESRRFASMLHAAGKGQFLDNDGGRLPDGWIYDFGKGEPVAVPAAAAHAFADLRRKEEKDAAQGAAESEMSALASAEAATESEPRTGWAVKTPNAWEHRPEPSLGWTEGGRE